MPHQWTQGDVAVNAECVVCDGKPGSARRIPDGMIHCLWCHATVRSTVWRVTLQYHGASWTTAVGRVPYTGRTIYTTSTDIVLLYVCWLLWFSCQYLPSDWLERPLWGHLNVV